ncbi:MAG: hypothetical protein J6K43_00120 [Lachnospiraceae bacterium]|nr:hypothetical protein [Lachnospiraceae bacterium]
MTKKYRLFKACKDFSVIQLSNYRGANSLKAARILAGYGYRTMNAVGGIQQYDKELTVSRQ